MELIKFKEQNITFAKDQPEYMPMPAHKAGDPSGTIICCWKLTEEERRKVMATGVIWHSMMTFNDPIQPQLLTVDSPFNPGIEKEDKFKPWSEYAIGTKAYAVMGGCWIKTKRGWKWDVPGGGTFPTPGGDACYVKEFNEKDS